MMNRGKTAVMAVGLMLIASLAWAAISRTTFTPPGGEETLRYEIVQIHGAEKEGQFPVVFRLDSQTGRTWRYVPPIRATSPRNTRDTVEGWLMVPEITDERLLDETERFLP